MTEPLIAAPALVMADVISTSPPDTSALARRWRLGALLAAAHGARLSTRIVLTSLGMLLLLQTTGFGVIRASIERNARATLSEELAVGQRVWRRLLDQRAQKLALGASMLAADDAFRAAVVGHDTVPIGQALDKHSRRVGATTMALLDPALALRASGGNADAAMQATLRQLSQAMGSRNDAVAVVGQQGYQFAMVPIKTQAGHGTALVGWVVMGQAMDQSLIDDMHSLSGLQAALTVTPAAGQAMSTADAATLVITSLPVQAQPALSARANAATDGARRRLSGPIVFNQMKGSVNGEVDLAGQPYIAMSQRIDGDIGGAVHVMVLRALADATAPFAELQLLLALITAGGLVLFGLGSAWTARRVARPLQSLVDASERFASGDYAQALDHLGRADEIGELARALDHMRLNIGQQRAEIYRLAYWDRLTGLPNRLQFRDAVERAIAQAVIPGQRDSRQAGDAESAASPAAAPPALAVMMLDLDRFKHVNDVLGHAFGDRLLRAVTERLQSVAREGDTVARLGGDEFALLLPHSDAAQALGVARRIAANFEQALHLDDHIVDLSAGIGIASWPAQARDVDTLLSHAEAAMYMAKQHTAGAQVYDPSRVKDTDQTVSLLSELRHALEHDELRLYLQPKIDLRGASTLGAEALVRWQHPTRGLLAPAHFVPFAEQTGFIRQVTLWMFAEVARQQSVLHSIGIHKVSVNLSTRDLHDQDLPDKLDALLQQYGAQAKGLCLEITESAMMEDPKRAEATLNRLAERGYTLSIDDFGTGYSSLAYLKRLPVRELKIDRSFVMGMAKDKDKDDAMIVRSTIDLAHNLGLRVVAEGVENATVLAQLELLDCDEAQGYHIARPMPAADIRSWVAIWNAKRPGLNATVSSSWPGAGELMAASV